MGFIRSAVVHTREGVDVECVVTDTGVQCPLWLREGDTLHLVDTAGRHHFKTWAPIEEAMLSFEWIEGQRPRNLDGGKSHGTT